MKKIILTNLFLILIELMFSQTNVFSGFVKDFTVKSSSPLELTDNTGNSLNISQVYKIQIVTRGTGTKSGAEYLVWTDNSHWKTRAVNTTGTNSNHPILIVEDNVVKVTTSHTVNYMVRAFVKKLESSEADVTPNIFGSSFHWQRNRNDMFYLDGNVGIGTDLISNSNNNYKLVVNGTIRAKEILVETGWADFVFEEGYHLPLLSDVEKHIKENGHLPEIPSAKDVEENGISVGEMNAKLLQKIEELTLYVIQQQKEIEILKEQIIK